MPTKEHEIITGVVIVIIVFMLAGLFILFMVMYYNQRKKKHIREKESMQHTFRNELLQTQLEIQEQTFQNISQDIHDNIGQSLSFVKLNLNMINLDQRLATENKLKESKKLLTKAIQDLRDLSKMLNTDFINETGLVNAIEQQLTILEKTGVYQTQLTVAGEVDRYQLQRELVCFRIVQELLNNIVKHAAATTIIVHMNYEPKRLIISVIDNGKGFTVSASNHGLGLRNIVNRISLINGTVAFTSAVTGTAVTIELNKLPSANETI